MKIGIIKKQYNILVDLGGKIYKIYRDLKKVILN